MPPHGNTPRKKKLFPFLNAGERGGDEGTQEFHDIEQMEHNLRSRGAEETLSAITATPVSPVQTKTPVERPKDSGPDRWHKYSDFRITVSKKHKATRDAVAESDAFDNITDAIAFAKTYYAALLLIYGDPIIEIEVHGGQYLEFITIDVSYLRLVGIGMPVISAVNDPHININPVITVTATCARFYMHGFEVINLGGEGYDWNLNAGLTIAEGPESGSGYPAIWISNCYYHGPGTQIYSLRSSYFDCVRTLSTTNIDSGYSSVECRFAGSTADIQTKWTIFRNCHFISEHGSDKRSRGMSVRIRAVAPNEAVWYQNNVTIGTGAFARTGVLLDHCTIDGATENFGWALQYEYCYGIQGTFINGTSGSYHHTIRCNFDQGVNAITWMSHTKILARYLGHPRDDGAAHTGGTCYIFISHTKHSAPDAAPVVQAGTCVWNTVAPKAVAFVYADYSNTHAKSFYDIGGGEIAQRMNTVADPGGVNQGFYFEGYLNV